jgi:hypothetical protein
VMRTSGSDLAADLWLFWTRGGRIHEGQTHLQRLLEHTPGVCPSRAWALHAASNVAFFAGDLCKTAHLVGRR